jgi:hypothetical protein
MSSWLPGSGPTTKTWVLSMLHSRPDNCSNSRSTTFNLANVMGSRAHKTLQSSAKVKTLLECVLTGMPDE